MSVADAAADERVLSEQLGRSRNYNCDLQQQRQLQRQLPDAKDAEGHGGTQGDADVEAKELL